MPYSIPINDQALACVSQRYRVRRLALFGSVLRPADFRPTSDVDVLVEFEPGQVPSFGFVALQYELSSLLGRRVDLHTPASLSPYVRDTVVREAELLWAAPAPA